MKTSQSAPESAAAQPDTDHDRDRQRRATELRALRTAAHLAGYSALIGYIWRQRRASQHAA